MIAIILAAGEGKRLLPYTLSLPKPMLPLGKKPVLEYLIHWIKNNNITSIIICVCYLKEKIQNYFRDGKDFNININYASSSKLLGTAGQLKTAEKFIDNTFVCLYADSLYTFDLQSMIKQHKQNNSFATIGICEYVHQYQYGIINVQKNNTKITSWKEKPLFKNNINIGCYVFERDILNFIPKNQKYEITDVVNTLLTKKRFDSFITDNFVDIGSIDSYKLLCDKYR